VIQFGAWAYFWFTVSALILAWWAWFTVRTYRNLPSQALKRRQAKRMRDGYDGL
jgi:hypothetical protein